MTKASCNTIKYFMMLLLSLVLVIGLSSGLLADRAYADTDSSSARIVVTGDQVISGGKYTPENITAEKAYSLDKLKQLASEDPDAAENNQYIFSAKNNYDNMNIYKVEGVRISAILTDAGLGAFAGKYSVRAIDGYEIIFDPAMTAPNVQHEVSPIVASAGTRYYYPQIWRAYIENEGSWTDEQKREGAVEVPSVIGWAAGGAKENGNYQYVDPSGLTPSAYNKDQIKLSVGQIAPEDYNNPLWNGETSGLQLIAGEPLGEVLTVDNQVNGKTKDYSRADIMVRGDATKEISWSKDGAEQTMYCRGVSLLSFIGSNPYYHDGTCFVFKCADGSEQVMTKAELKESGAMLCYETGESEADLRPILKTEPDGAQSFFTLCCSDKAPVEGITEIQVYNEPPQTPDVPAALKVQSKDYESVTVSWNQVKGATSYEIYRSKVNKTGTFSLAGVVETTDKFTDVKLQTGQKYYYKVRAVVTDPQTDLSAFSEFTAAKAATPKLGKPVIKKITTSKKAITLKWAKVSGANGYKVYRATSRSGKYKVVKTIKSGKTLTFKNTKLKKGKKYYYKIRAYRNVSGKLVYSSYSAVKYKKVK